MAHQEARDNVFDGPHQGRDYVASVTQLIVDIAGQAPGPGAAAEHAPHGAPRYWHQGQEVKVAFWAESCSLITDVEAGMASKDLMGEVVKRA